MLMALLIGMAFNFLLEDEGRVTTGVEFSSRTLLRAGVALLGVRISASDFLAFGWEGMTSLAGLVLLTIGSGLLFAWLFQKSWRFGLLSGGAVAICGASAALAIAAVIARGPDDEADTLFTVIAVATLSTIAMVLYPVLFGFMSLNDAQIGFLLGATIHDVAQVVGAGYSVSEEAGDVATVAKLFRVALLPVVLTVVILSLGRRESSSGIPTLPGFLVVFLLLAGINGFGIIPAWLAQALEIASRALLVTAIAALGIKTSLKQMLGMGGQKIAVISFSTICLLLAAVGVMVLLLD